MSVKDILRTSPVHITWISVVFLWAYGAKKNKEAENYLTIKSKTIQVNATYPPINSLFSTFNLGSYHPVVLFFLPIKKLFQEEHLARYVLIHLHLAPFYCKVEKILEQTAYTLDTAENT